MCEGGWQACVCDTEASRICRKSCRCEGCVHIEVIVSLMCDTVTGCGCRLQDLTGSGCRRPSIGNHCLQFGITALSRPVWDVARSARVERGAQQVADVGGWEVEGDSHQGGEGIHSPHEAGIDGVGPAKRCGVGVPAVGLVGGCRLYLALCVEQYIQHQSGWWIDVTCTICQ